MMGYWNQGILERRGQGQELGNCSFMDFSPVSHHHASSGLFLPTTTDKDSFSLSRTALSALLEFSEQPLSLRVGVRKGKSRTEFCLVWPRPSRVKGQGLVRSARHYLK